MRDKRSFMGLSKLALRYFNHMVPATFGVQSKSIPAMEGIRHIHIRENSWLARIAAFKLGVDDVALTIGSTIHLHNASRQLFLGNEQWVRHELKHVEQFRRYGFFRFVAMYLVESLRKGYHNNRFEVEARQAEVGR